MESGPSRRWFRFSLRTLLVLVTALCCWLGWETSVVRQRRVALKEAQANPAFQFTTADQWLTYFPPGVAHDRPATVPLVRRWLGDQAIQKIAYIRHYQNFSETELARLARVFPEAKIQEEEPHQEPCHPGCFPSGTLVDTPRGPRLIESIQVGEGLIAFLPSGEMVTALVQSVFVTDNRLWQVETEGGVLLTTETQPLCLGTESLSPDQIMPAGKLQPGEMVLRRQDGNIQSVKVVAVWPTNRREKVFNLVLGDSEVFVAGGFLARSKPPAEPVLMTNVESQMSKE